MVDYPNFDFEITHRAPDSRARLGRLTTPHGTIETPNFIFCGTKASIKGLTTDQMRAEQTDIILANTYHLMIQPGPDIVAKMGGLHKFMNWDGPMLTDSGGFQIFSMAGTTVAAEIKGARTDQNRQKTLTRITEQGAEFRAYTDGRKIFLTPEKSIDIQRKLGADLIVQLDECHSAHEDKDYMARSMAMSHRWGDRSLEEFERGHDGTQALYGIVHGGTHQDLRLESAEFIKDRPFFGQAVGGALGTSKEEMFEVVSWCMPNIHQERPVHLLGIGDFPDLFMGVRLGIDTFDCVSPTRIARHGWALVPGEERSRINIRNAGFREDPAPILDGCECYTCRNFSRAYVHHLIRAGETLGSQLVSMHNVHTQNRLMRAIRQAVREDTLDELEREWVKNPIRVAA